MDIKDTISETYGAFANMMAKNKSNPLSEDDVLKIFGIAQLEKRGGGDLIGIESVKLNSQDAVKYWEEKDRPSVVKNIEKYFASVLS